MDTSAGRHEGWSRGLMTAMCASLAIVGWAEDAAACDQGYCVDALAPAADATGVATDARVWVFYSTTAGADPEISLVEDGTGQIVLTSVEHVEGAGLEGDEVRDRVARVEPLVGFSPGATYRVVLGPGSACEQPTVRFTTGTAAESAAPSFAGATTATVTCLAEPGTRTDCNDQDSYPRLRVTVDADAPATDAAGYRLYRDGVLLAVAPELPVTFDLLPEAAAGTECFSLQAFNVAGVEDGNGAEVCVDTSTASCDGQGGGGGADAGTGAGADAGSDAGQAGGEDAGGAGGEDAGSGAGADIGASTPDPHEDLERVSEGGCTQLAASSPSGGLTLLSLLGLALFVGRRRRR